MDGNGQLVWILLDDIFVDHVPSYYIVISS